MCPLSCAEGILKTGNKFKYFYRSNFFFEIMIERSFQILSRLLRCKQTETWLVSIRHCPEGTSWHGPGRRGEAANGEATRQAKPHPAWAPLNQSVLAIHFGKFPWGHCGYKSELIWFKNERKDIIDEEKFHWAEFRGEKKNPMYMVFFGGSHKIAELGCSK